MEKTLHIEIKGVKGIKNLSADLPLSPGLYAITGKNGSGKSTLMAAIANIYYNDALKKFFINSFSSEGFIKYELDDKAIICTHREDRWSKEMINGGFSLMDFMKEA
ncbi:hypothetical protein AF2641_11540 [Anoxybacillus flavithermus]|nr:hypothetical protein AF2641_11540 [Anoxybacillus flavithermus]